MFHLRGPRQLAGLEARVAEGARQTHLALARLKEGALENAILTSASFSIIATDEKGIVQLFNLGAERMLGYRADEVVDQLSPSDLHDPDEVRQRAEALSLELGIAIAPGFEALAFKASREIEDIYELTYVCKDGSRFPAIVSITALRAEDGAVIGYLLIGSDNSARKRAESLLTEAMEAAETANRAKSDFLSGMSHELRTPLNAILGFAQLIDTGTPAPTVTQKRSIDQILRAGWYLLELINEILDLAMIESGKFTLSNEPVSLAEIIAECQAMIEPQAASRGIRITVPTLDAVHYIQADRTRVKQVLINLLFNAVKYNRPDGTVAVDAIAGSAIGSIRINIRDTGMGLEPQQLEQLFQPFNRLGKQSGSEEGSGIGLAMSKRLVDLMGGTIGVESSPGQGSVFWVEFAAASAPTASLAAITEAAPAHDGTSGAPLRTVLYVEDNPANLELVSQLVARRGDLRLIGAPEASLGIVYARTCLPHLILMDINLPGMSGIEALEVLRADPVTAHIPVIALSANAVPRDIERALAAGFCSYITKPIVVGKFMLAIDAALSQPAKEPTC
jgi:signal transduction histidine kinase/ActR/RegA family two-component response regulator